MRRRSRVDANQVEIVKAFRKLGVQVQHLHTVGQGVADLLCNIGGKLVLVEVKDGSKPPSARQLTPAEKKWVRLWDVFVVESVEQAQTLVRNMK
jgi:hypothetical protein